MPKSSNRSNKIPKFIRKLNEMLDDKEYSELVAWLEDGRGFIILNPSRFIQQVLPQFFKHKNMASFVRQLNMYGFSRPKESNQNIYSHPSFIKGNLNSMRQIERKVRDKREAQESVSEQFVEQGHNVSGSSCELSDMCARLLQENQKLKKQNENLNFKLERAHQIQLDISKSLLSLVETQSPYYNGEINFPYQYEENKNVCPERRQVKNINNNGFHFGECQYGWDSQLSYLSLVNQLPFVSEIKN